MKEVVKIPPAAVKKPLRKASSTGGGDLMAPVFSLCSPEELRLG